MGNPEMKFELGQVVVTNGALDIFTSQPFNGELELLAMVGRHSIGDWGIMPNDDKALNDAAIENGERLVSKYTYKDEEFYIITEADRSVTTVLLTSEY